MHSLPSEPGPSPSPSTVDERPAATLRSRPEDFQVEEIPAYPPSGRGGHALVTFRKRGMTTPFAVRLLAEALGVDRAAAGWAGLKDRHAVTTQTVSLPFPEDRDLDQALGGVRVADLEILGAARHEHKLKPGHLRGNRFTIVLRDLEPGAARRATALLDGAARHGVPNAFGPQRFGRDGANPGVALAWLRGESRGPRDRSQQRLLFSALQSLLYNRVLERRRAAGTWNGVLPGDLAQKHDSGGMFLVPPDGPELADAVARAQAGQLSPTGPMVGAKMRWPEGEPGELERQVLAAAGVELDRLRAFKRLGRGTRRVLRLLLDQVQTATDAEERYLTVSFVLPKGGYATTVLAEICRPTDLGGTPSRSELA